MKKKKLFLLTAGVLGISLVGGTFAAWAVTDNASPFKIYVSPGEIQSDTETTYVTLSWGESQQIGNVGGLGFTEVRKAGVLDLRANTNTGAAIDATLSYAVEDSYLTGLAQYVVVDVYKGNAANTNFAAYDATATYAKGAYVVQNEVVYIAKVAITEAEAFNLEHWEAAKVTFTTGAASITVADETESLYSVFVHLGNGITNSIYSGLSSNEASITFDWGKTNGIVSTTTYYATGFSGTPYVYLWSSTTQANNKPFPGVQMSAAESAGYFKAQIQTGENAPYDMVIFSYGTWNNDKYTATQQSADLSIASFFGTDYNCFKFTGSGDSKGTAVAHVDVETTYYLVGTNLYVGDNNTGVACSWAFSDYDTEAKLNAVKLTFNDQGVASINVYTPGEGKLKVYTSAGDWIGPASGGDEDGNFTLVQANKYTVTFDKDDNSFGASQRA